MGRKRKKVFVLLTTIHAYLQDHTSKGDELAAGDYLALYRTYMLTILLMDLSKSKNLFFQNTLDLLYPLPLHK